MKKCEKKCKPHVTKREICFSGKWIQYEKITYEDSKGDVRNWENVKRVAAHGAAVIIAIMHPSERLVLIRQFRPPVDNYIIEFPAGLIDDGETCEVSAVRELLEETGYTGTVRKITNPVYSSPGLTDETICFVFMDIDEKDPSNINPISHNEDTEDIDVFLVDKNMISDFLTGREKCGDELDSKLLSYALS